VLAPAVREELRRDPRRPLGGLANLLDVGADARGERRVAEHEAGAPQHHGHLVVGLVRHAAGEASHGLQAVRLHQLLLEPAGLGHFLGGDVNPAEPTVLVTQREPRGDPHALDARLGVGHPSNLQAAQRLAGREEVPELGLELVGQGRRGLTHGAPHDSLDRGADHLGHPGVEPHVAELAIQHAQADRRRAVDRLDLPEPRPGFGDACGTLGGHGRGSWRGVGRAGTTGSHPGAGGGRRRVSSPDETAMGLNIAFRGPAATSPAYGARWVRPVGPRGL